MTDLMVIGESLVDIVHDTHRHPALDCPGGSPLNVAVGVARLGIPNTLVTKFSSSDKHGQSIQQHLSSNDVGIINAEAPRTNTATAHVGANGSATYDFDVSWNLGDASAVASTAIPAHAHTGSIATVLPPGNRNVLKLMRALRATSSISFDPNCRPSITPDVDGARDSVERFVAVSDIVKASDEDLAWLYPGAKVEDVMSQWLARGACLVVVTQGAHGSLAGTASTSVKVGAVPVDVVDTVGAGDSFMAALLAGLRRCDLLGSEKRAKIPDLDRATLQKLLAFSATAAAITCSRTGANPPSHYEMAKIDHVLLKPFRPRGTNMIRCIRTEGVHHVLS